MGLYKNLGEDMREVDVIIAGGMYTNLDTLDHPFDCYHQVEQRDALSQDDWPKQTQICQSW
jgi:hypothetical protein